MTRQGARPTSPKKSSGGLWWVAGVAVVAVIGLIGLSIWTAGKSGSGSATVDLKTDEQRGAVRGVWGKASAPVEVVEFGDFL